jgi:hypothetical protein
MADRFKFVSGNGDTTHAKELEQASKDGYIVKFVSCNPSNGADAAAKSVVVLMEKK